MISFDEASRLVAEHARPVGTETVPIARAAGRVLAIPVIAMIDAPPADSSAMDGYAVRDSDLPGRLRVVGESFAGTGYGGEIEAGSCVRIFTGGPVPPGADRVVIQEHVEREGDFAIFGEPAQARHIRRRASDFAAGEELIPAGRRLDPRAMVAAAGADLGEVQVHRRPRVRIIGTGDELASPGEARHRPGAIPESVSFGVAAMAEAHGGNVTETLRLADDLPTMEREAGKALRDCDLVVVTGGASVGERDFAKAMFNPHGLELIFSKVAIKPGKPVWLGRAGAALVLGLPGNPTSAMVTARLLLAPLVAGLGGHSAALSWREIALGADIPACGDRETFLRARLTPEGAGMVSSQDSSAQKALAEADLLLRRRPNAPPLDAGARVEAIDF